jgi:tetratricopeptide (TPR) repeat protein
MDLSDRNAEGVFTLNKVVLNVRRRFLSAACKILYARGKHCRSRVLVAPVMLTIAFFVCASSSCLAATDDPTANAHKSLDHHTELELAKYLQLTEEDKKPLESGTAITNKLFKQGCLLQKKHRWELALKKYAACATLEKNSALYHNEGLCYENLGKVSEALAAFKKALEFEGGFRTTKKHIANLYLQSGDLENARAWCNSYLRD